MSALGQKQTCGSEVTMSALPPKADIRQRDWDVRFVPIADISNLATFRQSRSQISGIDRSARRAARSKMMQSVNVVRSASVEFPIQAAPNRVEISPTKTCCK
jgi:hypothetical protein